LVLVIILLSFFVVSASCLKDMDCQVSTDPLAFGMICVNGVCVDDTGFFNELGACRDDSWCDENYKCESWACIETVEVAVGVGEEGGECLLKQDCESLYDNGWAMNCINNICVLDEVLLAESLVSCSVDGDCGESYTCVDSICTETVDPCLDLVCGEGEVCELGVCVLDLASGDVVTMVGEGVECLLKQDCEPIYEDGWARDCINNICVLDESLISCEGITCDSGYQCMQGTCVSLTSCDGVTPCEEGYDCIDGYCALVDDSCLDVVCGEGEVCESSVCVLDALDLLATGVGTACNSVDDCLYVDDVCYENQCLQAKGNPPFVVMDGVAVFLEEAKECVDDSECGFREFCDLNGGVEDSTGNVVHYCTITPSAAEREAKIDLAVNPVNDLYLQTLIALENDVAKDAELEIRRLENLQQAAKKLQVLVENGEAASSRLESTFDKIEERSEALGNRISSLEGTLNSGTLSMEDVVIINEKISVLENKKFGLNVESQKNLKMAAAKLQDNNLEVKHQQMVVKDKIDESKLSVSSKKKKLEAVNKKKSDYKQKLQDRKEITNRRTSASGTTSSAAAPTESVVKTPKLTPAQIEIIKRKEARQAAQSSG